MRPGCSAPLTGVQGNDCGTTWEDGAGGSKGVSKHLYTRFLVGGEELYLFGMHFLAFPTSASRCAQREAQATVIAELMQELVTTSAHVVVLGDMNDYDGQLEDSAGDVPNSRCVLRVGGSLRRRTNSWEQSAELLEGSACRCQRWPAIGQCWPIRARRQPALLRHV